MIRPDTARTILNMFIGLDYLSLDEEQSILFHRMLKVIDREYLLQNGKIIDTWN